eukprot:CAMPEP_0197563882 /NCGR_PEP_ID=MMETSP1320-20131121/29494_1 /TAXON_ID=91990 /ORGANISM="Bolidomonas sp., Strain RCC2347" /LENGTH=49 /DNA_ID= /DNA_START= /DNA_END= /DNA_ORIENTATION=
MISNPYTLPSPLQALPSGQVPNPQSALNAREGSARFMLYQCLRMLSEEG